MRKWTFFLSLYFCLCLLAGCAAGGGTAPEEQPPAEDSAVLTDETPWFVTVRIVDGDPTTRLLLAEYGEDPGMTYEPYMTDGYLVWADCESWVTSFRDGAMALEKVGDVSEPTEGYYGYYIIKYVSDVPEGPVALDEVRINLDF